MERFSSRQGVQRLLRPRMWLAAVSVVALAAAGVAIADSGSATTSTVSLPTFSATTVVKKNVTTCTGADGTYEFTDATYTGTASGSADPNLNGALQIEVRSVYNTTKNLGWLKGHLKIDSSTPNQGARGQLTAVNVNGQLQGFLKGDDEGPGGKLLGNVSASFAGATGFASGSLGTGTGTNTAIVVGGSCNPPHADNNKQHEKQHESHHTGNHR